MNKSELVDAIAQKSGLSKVDSKKALDATLDAIADELKSGGKVVLVGFGTFPLLKEVPEKGLIRVPKKQSIFRPKKVVKFKPGSELSSL